MKFIITRTSQRARKGKPCEEAILEQIDKNKELYTIEISSLNELIDFIKKQEHAVVIQDKSYFNKGLPSIEIYDDWRE